MEFYIDNVSYTVTSSNAIITPYSNRISFYSEIDSNPFLDKIVEGWDSFSEGAIIFNGSTINGINYYSQIGDLYISWRGAQTSRPSTLGTTGRPDNSFWPGDQITFTFDRKCLAFGISINTAGRNDGNYKAITNSGDIVLSYYDPFPGYDTGQFVGFISDTPFNQITLSSLPFPPGENVAYGFDDLVCAIAVEIEVDIDIKPGSYPNSINLKSSGKVPVAILTTDDFDAYDVDPVSCVFAGAYPLRWNMEDVDYDGDYDILFHFMTQELDLTKESTEATMECETIDEVPIIGTDSVNIVPKDNANIKKIK
jgi:hypothetical protein